MISEEHTPTPLVSYSKPVRLVPAVPPSKRRWRELLGTTFALMGEMGKLKKPKADAAAIGQKVRLQFESLGGLWLKLGQILALRQDLFPSAFCEELSELQDKSQAYPFESIRETLEAAMGGPVHKVFAEFEEEAFSAASIAQVHRARLNNRKGSLVAVKIQKPYSVEYFTADFKFLKRLFGVFQRLGLQKRFRWGEMLTQLRQLMDEELDFRYEAANMKRMRVSLKAHRIHVPKVYERYSTKQVVVMEYVRGVLMSDLVEMKQRRPKAAKLWLEANGISPKRVAEKLLLSTFRQIYEDNLFHGDLHPGNIMLLRRNRVVLLDFGNVGSLDQEDKVISEQLLHAMIERRYRKAADLQLMMCGNLPRIPLNQVREEITMEMKANEIRTSLANVPFYEKSVTRNAENISKIFAKYQIPANWGMLKISKTWQGLDLSLGVLYPKINYLRGTERFLLESRMRKQMHGPFVQAAAAESQTALQAMMEPKIRERMMPYESVVGKVAQSIGFVFKIGFFIGVLAFIKAIYVFLYQHQTGLVDEISADEGWLQRLLRSIPQMGPEWWVLIIAGLAFILFHMYRFIRNITRPEVESGGSGAF